MKSLCSLILFIPVLLATPVSADIRVLLRFDASGHFAHKVIEVSAQKVFRPASSQENGSRRSLIDPTKPLSAIASGRLADHDTVSPRSGARAIARTNILAQRGFARLSWFDEHGVQIARSRVPDPRITHSPSHIDGFDASRTGLSTGAWLATGPDSAYSLVIQLPADLVLRLGAENWRVDLPRSR